MGLSPPILKVSLSPPRLETAVQCTQAKLAAPSRMWLVCAQRCHTLTLHSQLSQVVDLLRLLDWEGAAFRAKHFPKRVQCLEQEL